MMHRKFYEGMGFFTSDKLVLKVFGLFPNKQDQWHEYNKHISWNCKAEKKINIWPQGLSNETSRDNAGQQVQAHRTQ